MIVTQSIEDIKKPEFVVVKRTYEHRYLSNNWLKMHGKPMRRKPFNKMLRPLIDEAWMINTQNAISIDFFNKDFHNQNGIIGIGQHDPGRPVAFDIFRKKLERDKYMYKNIIIETDLLPFPNSLGNNGDSDIRGIKHGCSLCQHFLDKGWKEPLNIKHITSSTSSNEFYLEICKGSVHCMKLLSKFQSGTYKSIADGGDGKDDITIGFNDGEYWIYEGKHRVCVAKRFNIKTLPVLLEE